MKRYLMVFALLLGLTAVACGNNQANVSAKSQLDIQSAALDAASFAFAQEQLPADMSGVTDDGRAITGSFAFMDYIFVLDLTIADCKLSGTILVYQGESLVDTLTVKDNIVRSDKNPQYVGKINYSRKACAKSPVVQPIKADSCHGACDPAKGLFCKTDVDKVADVQSLIAACKTAADETCYGVSAEPLCQEVFDFYF